MRRYVRAARSWLVWWIASMLLWLALVSNLKVSEAIVGFGAAAVAATVAQIVRYVDHGAYRVDPRVLLRAWTVPYNAVKDMVVVFTALGRALRRRERLAGGYEVLSMRQPEDEPHLAGTQVLVTLAVSVTPNTYVVGFEPEADEVLVHQLVPQSPSSVKELMGP